MKAQVNFDSLGGGVDTTWKTATLTSDPQTITLGFEPSMILARTKTGSYPMVSYYTKDTNTVFFCRKGAANWTGGTDGSYGISAVTNNSFSWISEPNAGISSGMEYIAIP